MQLVTIRGGIKCGKDRAALRAMNKGGKGEGHRKELGEYSCLGCQ